MEILCPKCGNLLDPHTHTCAVCSKPSAKSIQLSKFLMVVIIGGIALLISVGLNVFQLLKVDNLSSDRDYYETQISEQQSTIDELESKTAKQKKEIAELKSDAAETADKMEFYEEYIVIVGKDDTYFHTYGCSDLDTSSFRGYNEKAAKNAGYIACPKCDPGI